MAREAEAMGMRYLTITDHSPTAHYAGSVNSMRSSGGTRSRVQEMVKMRLLRGTERHPRGRRARLSDTVLEGATS
jgi:DNA polymerase (family 10)